MAKPRVFVSSTYYDLKHIRASLEAFIDSLGYEAVLFESGDIVFRHDQPLDESCYHEIRSCHMLVLIVGGRYGSPASSDEKQAAADREDMYKRFNSITCKEYQTARERDVPIFIFVDKNVFAEYQTFRRNRDNHSIAYAYVDSINIFHLLDEILAQGRNNFIRSFENFDELSSWLRDQWAGLLADLLSRVNNDSAIADLSSQISDLRQVASVLREYSEVIMQKIEPEKSESIIAEQQDKLRRAKLQRFGREGLVRYVRKEIGKRVNSEVSLAGLYDIFLQSQSLEDFLERAGATPDHLQEMMALHGEVAERDYKHLKGRYQNVDAPTEDEAE